MRTFGPKLDGAQSCAELVRAWHQMQDLIGDAAAYAERRATRREQERTRIVHRSEKVALHAARERVRGEQLCV